MKENCYLDRWFMPRLQSILRIWVSLPTINYSINLNYAVEML